MNSKNEGVISNTPGNKVCVVTLPVGDQLSGEIAAHGAGEASVSSGVVVAGAADVEVSNQISRNEAS